MILLNTNHNISSQSHVGKCCKCWSRCILLSLGLIWKFSKKTSNLVDPCFPNQSAFSTCSVHTAPLYILITQQCCSGPKATALGAQFGVHWLLGGSAVEIATHSGGRQLCLDFFFSFSSHYLRGGCATVHLIFIGQVADHWPACFGWSALQSMATSLHDLLCETDNQHIANPHFK